MNTIKERAIVLLFHWTSKPLLLVTIEKKKYKKFSTQCGKSNESDMALLKIFAVLILTTIISTVMARPGYGSYVRHATPIAYSYTYPSYSYPSYSYPSYGYGHGLYSSYSYPLYGYGHGSYGLGGWLGDYW